MKAPDWTRTQKAQLRKLWLNGENLKKNLHLFGDRSYMAVVAKAKKMKLGRRPVTSRGKPAYAWDVVKAELELRGPGTVTEIVKRSGLSTAAVHSRIRLANPGPDGAVHIADWKRRSTGGVPVAIYALGPGENAIKPANLTTAENNRRARAKKKSKANPFAAAAGLVSIPTPAKGRVYINLTDYEKAA